MGVNVVTFGGVKGGSSEAVGCKIIFQQCDKFFSYDLNITMGHNKAIISIGDKFCVAPQRRMR